MAELKPVVDTGDFVSISHFSVHGRLEQGHRVGEVELALVVVGGELGQHLGQLGPVEAVDTGVGEVVETLLVVAVAVLHDRADGAVGIGKYSPVATGIVQPGREQSHGSATAAVLLQQGRKGLGA